MKKKFITLIVIAIAMVTSFCMVACSSSEPEPNNSTPSQTEAKLRLFTNDGTDEIVEVPLTAETTIETPSRKGFDFVGWSTSEDGDAFVDDINDLESISADTTLYAIWKAKEYTVYFSVGDTVVKTQTVQYGDSATAPTADDIANVTPYGKVFVRWDGKYDNVTKNLALKAEFDDLASYTVVFNCFGEEYAKFSGNETETVPAVTTPVNNGYVFDGWFDEDDKKYVGGGVFSANGNYQAKWSLATPNRANIDSAIVIDKDNYVITYGDSAEFSAIAPSANVDGITYTYEWLSDGNVLGTSDTITITPSAQGLFNYVLRMTASVEGYTSTYADQSFTLKVNKANLTAELGTETILYGEEFNGTTITYTGFKLDDDSTVVDQQNMAFETNYVVGASVDTYNVGATGLSAQNYNITVTPGKLNVNKRPISVVHTFNQTFDGTNPRKVLENLTVENLYDLDTVNLTYATSASTVGNYSYSDNSIVIETASVTNESGDVSDNYLITYDLSVAISEAAIEFTAPTDTVLTYDSIAHSTVVTATTTACNVYYSTDEETYSPDAPEYTDVGVYPVYYRITKDNYAAVNGSYTITINKASVRVTITGKTITYGDQLPKMTVTVAGTTYDELDLSNFSSAYEAGDDVGRYSVTLNIPANDNFDVTVINGTLTVKRRTIAVTVGSMQIEYGDGFSTEDCTYTLTNGTPLVGDVLQFNYSCDYSAGNAINTYPISATCRNDNYSVAVTHGSLTVVPKAITVKVDSETVTYGNSLILSDCSYTITKGALYSDDVITPIYSTDYEAGRAAGNSATISAAFHQNGNYDITIISGIVTVTTRALSITVAPKALVYGQAFDLAAHSHTVTGGTIYAEDDLSVEYACDYTVGAKVGAYTITASALNTNYSTTVVNGTLTVTPKAIQISLNESKKQNGEVYSKAFTDATVANMLLTDKFSGVLATTTAESKTHTADGTLGEDFGWTTALTITNDNGVNVTDCYTVTYQLSVTISNNGIDFSVEGYSGNYDGDTHHGVITINESVSQCEISYSTDNVNFSSEMPLYSNAGDYRVYFRITADYCDTGTGSYTVSILPIVAKITADDKNCTFGDTIDAYSYTQTGILAKDLASIAPTLQCDYEAGDNVGRYDIIVNYTPSVNYTITTEQAALTVSKKEVIVNAPDLTIKYGEAAPSFAPVGLEYDFISLQTDYTVGDNVGDYPAVVNCTNANYSATTTAKLTVTPLSATITANNINIVYGTTPNPTYLVNGLFGDDTVEVSFNALGVNAGTRDIIPIVTPNPNYNFNCVNGTLSISKTTLTIALDETTITYGEAFPSMTILSYTGFVFDDNATDLSGTLSLACDYTSAPKADDFAVLGGGLTSDNYIITISGSLHVEKAPLTIGVTTVAPITYGDNAPVFTAVASGLQFSDTLSVVNGYTIDCTYTKGSNANASGYPYSVNIAAATCENYTLTAAAPKYLVVNKASYTNITHAEFSGTYSPTTTLAAYALNDGFYWSSPTVIPTVGNNNAGYGAYYNTDSVNYNNFSLTVKVVLTKATTIITATNKAVNWTGSAYSLATSIGATSSNKDNSAVTYSLTSATDGGIYTVTLTTPATDNYLSATKTVDFSIKAVTIGSTYYTVEDALIQGGTITLVGNAFVRAGNYSVNSGTTLILPSSKDGSTTIGSPTYGDTSGNSLNYVDKNAAYIEHKLTFNSGATITVNGNILIQGVLGYPDQKAMQGATCGAHSQIINNGAMTFTNGSVFDVRGYVKGSGSIDFESGSMVYSPYVVLDFRGGTNTVTVFRKGNISPYSQYEMPNIQCRQTFYYGSSHTGYVDMYANSEHNTDQKVMIGNDGIIALVSGSRLIKTYNATTQKTSLQLIGSATMGSLTLSVSMSLFSVDVNMEDVQFPIPWTYDVVIGDGVTASSLTANYKYKLMTGASLTVSKNATLTTGESLIVYSQFTDTAFASKVYPNKPAAQLIVNGTMNINGAFGGTITSTESGARVILKSGISTSVSSKEGNSGNTTATEALLGGTFVTVATITETAKVKNADGSIVTASAGVTYTYNGSNWS